MPREGTPPYTYTLPAVYLAVPGTTIVVAQHNTPLEDIQSTLNGIQPINFGGTGAATAGAALTALGGASASQINYLAAGGSATVMTLTPTTALTALTTGVAYPFKAIADSTGPATMNVSGLGAKAVRKIVGATDVAIIAGDILNGAYYSMAYSAAANGAAGGWILTAASPASVTTFSDAFFRVQDNADATKQLALEVSGITTGTTRTYTAPNVSGNLALDGAGITTIASATTTNIGASVTKDVIISGVTTITAFDTVAAGTVRNVTASGAFLLTHNGTSLILPGAVSITTVAGDNFVAESLGSGNWRVTSYVQASGLPHAIGQTYQDLTASRAAGTAYQNTTGKPLRVENKYTVTSNAVFNWTCDASNPPTTAASPINGSTWATTSVIVSGVLVPPGFYYKYAIASGAATLNSWIELR